MAIDFDRAKEIRVKNDAFRKLGRFVVTSGVYALDSLPGLIHSVQLDSYVSEENDPRLEHDFGTFNWSGERIVWKISHFDQKLERTEDPLSPQCRRVLTVMLEEEYKHC